LAHRIWPVVYPSIISLEQIRYMLTRFYAPELLKHEIEAEGARYALIHEGTHKIGYVAWQPRDGGQTAFLSKLYLLPDRHGRGLGARALQWTVDEALRAGCARLMLRVNRNNQPAIRAYLRAGFAFESDLCTDIGGGFVMDDYVMTRAL
jgi:GNAT superfamily N-acetyltransferase